MVNDVEFKFEVPGCGHEFRGERFQVTEELSKPFHISLSLLSLDPDISFDSLIRKAGTLTLYGQGLSAARIFN
ncbi:type VI secretion system tip protein VgrG, partial [Vibrio parahaemolyticus]|nr:type VI secretion system tip protein VgrG [Vibrio parahaemolyticus]